MDSEYYKTLEEIIVRREERQDTCHIQPEVVVTSNEAIEEEVFAREVWFGSVTQKAEEELKSRLASLWQREISNAPPCVRCDMEQEPPEAFLTMC